MTGLRLGLAAVGLLCMYACVTDSTFQRAEALREPAPEAAEVQRSLVDPDWKLRVLAAKACGRSRTLDCGGALLRAGRADRVVEVRSASHWALGKRCGPAERAEIASLLEEAEPVRELFVALIACPSADGWLLLSTRDELEGARDGVAKHGRVSTTAPEELDARRAWLEEVATLGPPNERLSDALDEVARQLRVQAQEEARRRREEAAARVAARKIVEEAAAATAAAVAEIDQLVRRGSYVAAIARLEGGREAGVQGLDEAARRIGEAAWAAVPAPRDLTKIEGYFLLVGALAVPEAEAARDEAMAALWPEFPAWLKLPQNGGLVRELRRIVTNWDRCDVASERFNREKERNDARVRPRSRWGGAGYEPDRTKEAALFAAMRRAYEACGEDMRRVIEAGGGPDEPSPLSPAPPHVEAWVQLTCDHDGDCSLGSIEIREAGTRETRYCIPLVEACSNAGSSPALLGARERRGEAP